MLLGATIAVGACTDQSALPTGSTSTSDATEPITSAALVVDVDGFFTGRGCVLQRGRATPTSIAIRRQDGHYAIFDCDGVEAKEIAAAEREYHNYLVSIRSPVFGAYATAGYYSWAYSSSEYVCSSGGSISISGYSEYPRYVLVTTSEGESWQEYVFGNYTITGSSTGSCDWVDTFVGTYHEGTGDGDGSGDEGGCCAGGPGGDVPPSSPPPPPPEPGDSLMGLDFEPLVVANDTINCQNPLGSAGSLAWCLAKPVQKLAPEYLTRLNQANERMRAKGGICETKAALVDALINNLAIRSSSAAGFTGWAPEDDGAAGGIYLHETMLRDFYDESHKIWHKGRYITLQFVLSHEVDHLLGEGAHTVTKTEDTANAWLCSEFGPD